MFRSAAVLFFLAGIVFALGSACAGDNADAEQQLSEQQHSGQRADWVDPMVGVTPGRGSCVPGVCLSHASTYASPDTIKGATGGYLPGQPIVGFSQLHTQGTGGTPSYGNFLISPQIGLETVEAEHASPKSEELARCYYYKTRLDRYGIVAEVVPTRHAALYRFTFPAAGNSHLVIDVARKLAEAAALEEGDVTIDAKAGTIRGGGTFTKNWNPAPYQLYFSARLSKTPAAVGTWEDGAIHDGGVKATAAKKRRLGAYARYTTTAGETILLKIAVSFRSQAQADAWLEQEVPGWDFEGLKSAAADAWNKALAVIDLEGATPAERRNFYSSLFHTMVQPRDRTGDNHNWDTGNSQSDAPFWDDHYTLWDTWKTLFPLMTLIRPDVTRGNVNSFIDRHRHNGYVATAFIQGKEYKVGQGGDEVDNIIADAYVKHVSGIDWNAAYELLKFHVEKNRTKNYREHGFVAIKEKSDYCPRMKSASSTIGFAYNDWCAAQVAKGLGHEAEAARWLRRSQNWQNVWDATLEDSGFTGFTRARQADGRFAATPARKGYNTDFYEGTCWIYSYVIPHDVPGLISKMGGRQRFIERLSFALRNRLIDFTNEPSFMTLWLFDQVERPYLASHWAAVLRGMYDDRGYPGDEDDGAMSSLYVFLCSGIFPFAGQDVYYLHGPCVPKMVLHLEGGHDLTIVGKNAGGKNIYIQSAALNGRPLVRPWVHHASIAGGGTLEFTMGPAPSAWCCGKDFDAAAAARETAPLEKK